VPRILHLSVVMLITTQPAILNVAARLFHDDYVSHTKINFIPVEISTPYGPMTGRTSLAKCPGGIKWLVMGLVHHAASTSKKHAIMLLLGRDLCAPFTFVGSYVLVALFAGNIADEQPTCAT